MDGLQVVVQMEHQRGSHRPASLARSWLTNGVMKKRTGKYELRCWNGIYILDEQGRVESYFETFQYGKLRHPNWTFQTNPTKWNFAGWQREARRTACALVIALRGKLDVHVAARIAHRVATSWQDASWDALIDRL
jgi:hypothetical protein